MAIRLSGMVSGMDTESLVSALVSSYKLKKDNLVKAQTKLSWKQEKWKTMNTSIYGFYSGKLSSARFSTSYNLKTSTVSNDKYAKVSASSSAVSGTQRLKVNHLAATGYLTGGKITATDKSKVTGSTKLSDIIGTKDGSISVKTSSGIKSIDITEDMNVSQFVAKLKETGLNANFDDNNGRFFISAKESGKDNDFSLTANDANGLNALKALGIYTVNDTDKAEYTRLAKLTEGTDAYNTELESMYTKATAKDTAKNYADKYNVAKDKLDALAADDTWDHLYTLDEYVAKLKTETPDLLNAYDKYKKEKVDSDGNTVDEWTSTEESHVIKELVVGKEYTITETKPADGYVTAESITFTVENTAEIQKHEMKDDVTKVQISKTDITGETEIPGAKLTILDKDDQVVESWTSTEEAHYIEKLPIGKYTLREEQAAKGYLLTADVTFEVKDTGEIQKVAMKDDTAKGKVILNKTDKSSGEPLKGVEFELRDSKGKVLETLKTDAAGHAESKLYEIATFKNGKYDTAIKYYLVETKTLDGYTLDQTKHEVTFAYANDSTPVVEVTFNLTNEKPEVPETPNTPDTPQSHEETKVSNAPKTGDSTNIWLPILLLVISTGGMAGLYICRKRKNK